jgi:hypothetical protein
MRARRALADAKTRARSEASSFLDTEGTTRQVAEKFASCAQPGAVRALAKRASGQSPQGGGAVVEHPRRKAWTDEVERLTAGHREQRAREYEAQARRREHHGYVERKRTRRSPDGPYVQEAVKHLGLRDGLTERTAKASGDWQRSRARGQRERFVRICECAEADVLRIECSCCGAVDEQPGRCGASLVCLRCRGKRARRLRRQFLRAREVLLQLARARGLLSRWRKGGRYSEKLLTLTVPHHEGDTVRGRIELVLAAWGYFLKSLNAWARTNRVELAWVRVLEWVLGHDGLGHPHIHVWIFSPFLPQNELTAWWRAALVRAGLRRGDDERLLDVDVREAGDRVADELIKYLVKDIGAGGGYVDPAVFAEVYATLDGRRAVQGSRGFLGLGDGSAPCRHCGASRSLRVRVQRNRVTRAEQVRGDLERIDAARGPRTTWSAELEAEGRP